MAERHTKSEALLKVDEMIGLKQTWPDDELPDLLSSIISGIDFAKGNHHSHSGIFWALTRLVGCYERLCWLYEQYIADPKNDAVCYGAELEVEHFLIRLRVLIDEIAYLVRLYLPKQVRGLSELKGPGPVEYKQFSINAFLSFVSKQPTHYPLLTNLIENNRLSIDNFISRRDDIVHFRAKAIILRKETMFVGFIDRNFGKEVKNVLPHEDLADFANPAITWVWQFMQRDVTSYFRGLIADGTLAFSPLGVGLTRISMPGSRRLKALLGEKILPTNPQANP